MNALRNACGMFAAAAVLMAAGSASAAVIAGYSTGYTSTSTPVTETAANATATPLTGGAQTTIANQVSLHYASAPWVAIQQNNTGSPTNNSQFFVEFAVAPAAGYALNLSSVSFDGGQGGGTANTRGYAIYTSVDTDLAAASVLPNTADIASGNDIKSGTFSFLRPGSNTANATLPTISADLSAARYQGLTSAFKVRVYFVTTTNSQNIDLDNFTLNGTVSAVPEPASIAALAGAGLVALRRRRRA